MNATSRLLTLSGAAAVATSALLPWVQVRGLPLDLDLLGTEITATETTVGGLDTPVWPALVGVAALVALLALIGRGRKLLGLLGAITVLAGAALTYYLFNVIDIETSKRSVLERTLADVVVESSVKPGPYLLLAGGVAIVVGAISAGPRRAREPAPVPTPLDSSTR